MNTPKFIEVETVTNMKVIINASQITVIHPIDTHDIPGVEITDIETMDSTIWHIITPYEEIKTMLEGLNA